MYVDHSKLTTWTPANVLLALETSDTFVERCIMLLHSHQTELERLARVTINDNESGLQQADAKCFSLLAEKLKRGDHLNDVDLEECRIPWKRGLTPVIRIGKYRKQLVRIFESQARMALEAVR
jgi:hypothetical protein